MIPGTAATHASTPHTLEYDTVEWDPRNSGEREHVRERARLAVPRDVDALGAHRRECERRHGHEEFAHEHDDGEPCRDGAVVEDRADADEQQQPVGHRIDDLAEVRRLVEVTGDVAVDEVGGTERPEKPRRRSPVLVVQQEPEEDGQAQQAHERDEVGDRQDPIADDFVRFAHGTTAYDPAVDGTVALVTGAGSGLGAAISRRLAADGAYVVVNDLSTATAESVAEEIKGEAAVFDVADSAAFDAAVDRVVADHGRLDVLVNNAGILNDRPEVRERSMAEMMARMGGQAPQPVGVLSTMTDAEFDRMMKVHVYGTFHGMRAALRHMEPARAGRIVNLASIYGLRGSAGTPDYAAAKHAIVGLTRSTALEVAPLGIHVNAVAPGFIDTPLLAPVAGPALDFLTMQIPSGRLGRAEEVAELVRFLAGPESSYCFGEVLTLTGGY